jgi:hypothetical protein
MPRKKTDAPVVRAPKPRGVSGVELKGKYAVLKKPEGRDFSVVQLIVRCTGGFGCSPRSLGTAVFGTDVVRGSEHRYDRFDFERLATADEVKEAKEFYERNAFEPVRKRRERGLKLLLAVMRHGGEILRLLRHKKDGMYKLFIYTCENDMWDLTAAGAAPVVDELLLEMNKRLKHG